MPNLTLPYIGIKVKAGVTDGMHTTFQIAQNLANLCQLCNKLIGVCLSSLHSSNLLLKLTLNRVCDCHSIQPSSDAVTHMRWQLAYASKPQ